MNRSVNGGGTLMPPNMKSFGSSPDLQNGVAVNANYSSIQRRYGIENFDGGEGEEIFENSTAMDFQHHQMMLGSSAEFNATMFYEEQQRRNLSSAAGPASNSNRRHSIGDRSTLRPKTPPPPPPALGLGKKLCLVKFCLQFQTRGIFRVVFSQGLPIILVFK